MINNKISRICGLIKDLLGVEVKTFDRQTVQFRVTRYNAEGLGGTETFYRYSDMASLKVERPENKNKESDTMAIIFGLLGVVALGFLIANGPGKLSVDNRNSEEAEK